MTALGVFEIFYGLPWPDEDRLALAPFLKELGYKFYIYGPKAEESLRKQWQRPLTAGEQKKYTVMRRQFSKYGLQFGVALSPQGLNNGWDSSRLRQLEDKVKALSDIGVDTLGIFFDDMKSSADMARRQLEIVHRVQNLTTARIVFCPSYYSDDSLLDLLFGDRPVGYLQEIGSQLGSGIEILWTGESIISQSIQKDHLENVAKVLKRKPFICDNFYANDGPINCNFLRLLPPVGRDQEALARASAWGLNPMNQFHLSKVVLQAFVQHLLGNKTSHDAFVNAVQTHSSHDTAEFILSHRERFANEGLLALSGEDKKVMIRSLHAESSGIEREILNWLEGHYAVDLQALFDQSGFGE